ncbi:MAG: MFS transporter [Gammaproteobacteria bacterium]|nr:MFS transporter [Gammaproteobacteria bacterium]MDD9959424.1 MFS transporter [Gammaproteobacteria bacterium]
MEHYSTAQKDRIPFHQKVIYGCGAFVNNLLAAAIGGMVIVLNLGLGMNPALVGLLSALPRLTDAITDPLMGYISDNTKSRWGRRRPYIFVGAILVGIVYAVLWQLPESRSESFYFWYFLCGSFLFYLAYTIFVTPWVALGYELTPDYHERTRLMGVQNFIGQFAYVIAPWFLLFMQNERYFDDMVDGAGGLAIIIAIVVIGFGILPALFLRERYQNLSESELQQKHKEQKASSGIIRRNIAEFLLGFLATIKVKAFLKLCIATFLVFNGFIMVSSFQSYVIIYYVFGGDTVAGAEYAGYAGTLGAVSTFIVITIVTWLSTRLGKRKAFFVATSISMLGYALKWFCYDPEIPLLILIPAPLIAFGLGGLFTLMPSMIADVVDLDELNTHQRREGMFGSIFWWVVKLGMAVALAAGGFLLNATGFSVDLGSEQTDQAILMMRIFDAFVPCIASGIAIWVIASYSITEEKAHDIRLKLESIRGSI